MISKLQKYNLFLNDNDFLFYEYNCMVAKCCFFEITESFACGERGREEIPPPPVGGGGMVRRIRDEKGNKGGGECLPLPEVVRCRPCFPSCATCKPPFRSERRNLHRSTVNWSTAMQMHFAPQKRTLIYSALRFQHLKITPKTAIFQRIFDVISTILFAVFRKTHAFSGKACDEGQSCCHLCVWEKKGDRPAGQPPCLFNLYASSAYSLSRTQRTDLPSSAK